jgi:hypothetical protein
LAGVTVAEFRGEKIRHHTSMTSRWSNNSLTQTQPAVEFEVEDLPDPRDIGEVAAGKSGWKLAGIPSQGFPIGNRRALAPPTPQIRNSHKGQVVRSTWLTCQADQSIVPSSKRTHRASVALVRRGSPPHSIFGLGHALLGPCEIW